MVNVHRGGLAHCRWCHPRAGGSGIYKKVAEQAQENKLLSRLPLLQALTWYLLVMDCNP